MRFGVSSGSLWGSLDDVTTGVAFVGAGATSVVALVQDCDRVRGFEPPIVIDIHRFRLLQKKTKQDNAPASGSSRSTSATSEAVVQAWLPPPGGEERCVGSAPGLPRSSPDPDPDETTRFRFKARRTRDRVGGAGDGDGGSGGESRPSLSTNSSGGFLGVFSFGLAVTVDREFPGSGGLSFNGLVLGLPFFGSVS